MAEASPNANHVQPQEEGTLDSDDQSTFDAGYDHWKDIRAIEEFLTDAARRFGWRNYAEVVRKLNLVLTFPLKS
jgi:hypothetical protein